MSRDASLSPEERAAERAELASAEMVVQALQKAERGFSLYLPNNPLHEKFFEDFSERLHEHLDRYGELLLEFTTDTILCRGKPISTSEDRRESLAFRMFGDGLRRLTVAPGIDRREERALVDAIRFSVAESGEDDIVTRLWSAGAQHIRYELAGTPSPAGHALLLAGAAAAAADAGAETQQERIRSLAADLAAAALPPRLPQVPAQIFGLGEEAEDLQKLVVALQEGDPVDDLVGILEALLGGEADPALLGEFLEIVARLCGDLLIAGRLNHAVRVLAMLGRLEGRPGLAPGAGPAIAAARGRVITPEVLAGLGRLLAHGEGVDREDLRALVTTFGSAAVEPFCRILGDVDAKETRKILIDALAETGREAPDLFLPFLGDPRWYLVRNTIYILRRIGSPEASRAVRRCAGHRDPRVRKEVVLFLEETADAAGEPLLLALLDDPVPSLRIAAARGLARRGARNALEPLLALAGAPAFAERERPEREAVWEAIADLAPEQALPLLGELLLKRRWFGQRRELEDTACAVAGLRRLGTPAARSLLEQAAARKRGEARGIVERALRALPHAAVARRRGQAGEGESDRG